MEKKQNKMEKNMLCILNNLKICCVDTTFEDVFIENFYIMFKTYYLFLFKLNGKWKAQNAYFMLTKRFHRLIFVLPFSSTLQNQVKNCVKEQQQQQQTNR